MNCYNPSIGLQVVINDLGKGYMLSLHKDFLAPGKVKAFCRADPNSISDTGGIYSIVKALFCTAASPKPDSPSETGDQSQSGL